MHTSLCVPPSAALETVLAPLPGDGKSLGALAGKTDAKMTINAGHALVVSSDNGVGVELTYDGAGDAVAPIIWLAKGTKRVYPRARVRTVNVYPPALPAGITTTVSAWTEEVKPNGPWGEE